MNKIYIFHHKTDCYGFVKEIACQKYNIDISTIVIERNNQGKPYLKDLPDFHFNISHSGDVQAVAVSDKNVGVDIEKLRPVNMKVTKRFCDNETAYIKECNSDIRFFEVWTKKEAFLKYKGTGISGGLDSFNVFNTDIPIKTYIIGECLLSVCSENEFEIIEL